MENRKLETKNDNFAITLETLWGGVQKANSTNGTCNDDVERLSNWLHNKCQHISSHEPTKQTDHQYQRSQATFSIPT